MNSPYSHYPFEFLYPTSRQYPVDGACIMIVQALEARNFSVPGLKIEFQTYGSGAQKMRYVSTVEGEDFWIHFSRRQRPMPGGRWNDTAAVCDIVIPHKKLSVYEDESGPTLKIYVGTDWESDRKRFTHGALVNAKLNGEPRTYVRYSGCCMCRGDRQHFHSGRRAPILLADNDLRREYDPEGDEPPYFQTSDVMDEFRRYLLGVLAKILEYPQAQLEPHEQPASIPFPEGLGSLFCFAERDDADRIEVGQQNLSELALHERYGLSGGGYRLLALNVRNDGTVPEIAYEGFLWCGIGAVTSLDASGKEIPLPIKTLEEPGHYRNDRERYVVRISPKLANDIYVADHAAYELRRQEIWKEIVERRDPDFLLSQCRDRLTDAEVNDFLRARARTIVPIHEYKGGFVSPVVLIGRELDFDEVELVSD